MRNNQPNTGRERMIPEGVELITTTDLKGVINACNQDFVDVSGYSREELIGQAHNIVRNPDVPSEIFADMWSTLQSRQPWMGIVKNRCKNGDHYWVDAFTTPIVHNNSVVGYESVRRAATREQIADAEKLYAQIKKGEQFKVIAAARTNGLVLISVLAAVIVGFAAYLQTGAWLSLLVGLVVAMAAGGVTWWLAKPFKSLASEARSQVENPVLQRLYTGDMTEVGSIELARLMRRSRQRTMLGRSHYAAVELNAHATKTSDIARDTHDGVTQQRQQTEAIAAAMEQMSASIAGVADSARLASEVANDIDKNADAGRGALALAEQTVRAIDTAVTGAASAMDSLNEDAESIGSVTQVIQTIAEQTNLLALNAAIEAARAGEQGRGFAVVADEVRLLASRTAESTLEIRNIIESLQSRTREMVGTMEQSREEAHQGVNNTQRVKEELEGILSGVTEIKAMNLGISTAAQEQSVVSHEISANIHTISDLAQQTTGIANLAMQESNALDDLASELENLVERFRD